MGDVVTAEALQALGVEQLRHTAYRLFDKSYTELRRQIPPILIDCIV